MLLLRLVLLLGGKRSADERRGIGRRELEEIEEQDRRVSTLADDAKGSAKGNAIGQGHAASLDS